MAERLAVIGKLPIDDPRLLDLYTRPSQSARVASSGHAIRPDHATTAHENLDCPSDLCDQHSFPCRLLRNRDTHRVCILKCVPLAVVCSCPLSRPTLGGRGDKNVTTNSRRHPDVSSERQPIGNGRTGRPSPRCRNSSRYGSSSIRCPIGGASADRHRSYTDSRDPIGAGAGVPGGRRDSMARRLAHQLRG